MFFGQLHWQLSEILLYISDMEKPASGLKAAILDRTEVPGSVWTPSDFLDLGSREAVDKALQRLAKSDELRRIDRGLYDRPAHNRSEEHTSELQSLMRISYAVFCLKKKTRNYKPQTTISIQNKSTTQYTM